MEAIGYSKGGESRYPSSIRPQQQKIGQFAHLIENDNIFYIDNDNNLYTTKNALELFIDMET